MSYRQIEDDDLLRRLFDAVVRLGQSREALLTGVPPAVSASLPVLRSRADTLWSDLNQLNQMGELLDGSVPLVTWLKNGELLAGPRVEARVLQEALARVAPRPQTQTPRDAGAVAGRTTGPGDLTRHGGEVERDSGRGFRAGEPTRTSAGGGARSSDAPLAVVLHSPQDGAFAEALRVHAAVLRNTNRARFWFEGEIDAGARREVEIPRRIEQARVVLVLLSAAFLASDTMALVERALAEGRRVVPILARPCDWKSTAIGKLTTLPRNGVPIAQHASPDEAYAQIIGEMRDLLERLPAADAPAAAPPAGVEVTPARVLRVEHVFPDGGVPAVTYVEPAEQAQLLEALRRPDRGLVVEGPSAIGKTTAIRRALESLGREFVHLLPGDAGIDALQRPDDVQGWVVVDDFHQLDGDRKKRIAHLLKWMVDRPAGDRKVILVGVGEVARSVLAHNSNLLRRFDDVRIRRQPDAKVEELLTKGEAALNIVFEPRGVITALANGSFALAQQLGALAAGDAGITATERATKRVEVSRARLVDEMLRQLRLAYDDAVTQLLMGDRASPRGVYLALLWLLSRRDDESIPLTGVTNEYPQFIPVVDQLGYERIVAPLCDDGILSECVRVDSRRVTVVDPRFSFYLRNESFSKLARDGGLAGVAAVNADGLLELRGPGHAAPAPGAYGAPMWAVRDGDLFWPRQDVRALVKLLSNGYGANVQALLEVALYAGIPSAMIASHGRAVMDVARDVVDQARTRGLVKKLLEELRKDERIGGFWGEIDEMLGTPTARERVAT